MVLDLKMSFYLCNSSKAGVLYLWVSILGGFLGASFSFYLSVELSVPFIILHDDFYYSCVTCHGLVMLFFFLSVFASSFSCYMISSMCFLENMYLKSGILGVCMVSTCMVIFFIGYGLFGFLGLTGLWLAFMLLIILIFIDLVVFCLFSVFVDSEYLDFIYCSNLFSFGGNGGSPSSNNDGSSNSIISVYCMNCEWLDSEEEKVGDSSRSYFEWLSWVWRFPKVWEYRYSRPSLQFFRKLTAKLLHYSIRFILKQEEMTSLQSELIAEMSGVKFSMSVLISTGDSLDVDKLELLEEEFSMLFKKYYYCSSVIDYCYEIFTIFGDMSESVPGFPYSRTYFINQIYLSHYNKNGSSSFGEDGGKGSS